MGSNSNINQILYNKSPNIKYYMGVFSYIRSCCICIVCCEIDLQSLINTYFF